MKPVGMIPFGQFLWMLACLVSALSSAFEPAHAADLKAPFELESSQVLPKGVRNPRYKNVFMSVEDRFSVAGPTEPLGYRLNKLVTWDDLVAAQKDDTMKANVRGVIKANQLESKNPGWTTGTVNTYADVKVPVLAMGVTEKLTLAIAVPIMNIDVSVDKGFRADAGGREFVAALDKSGPLKAYEAAGKLNNAIDGKMRRLRYKPVESMNVSGVGDMKLVGKYNLFADDASSLTAKCDLTLPTGKGPDADRALDVPTGDGQYDVGVGAIVDHKFRRVPELRWNNYATYTMQVRDSLERRVPESSHDMLASITQKERLDRDLGDQIALGTSLSYTVLPIGMTFGSGYSFQFQDETTFMGTKFARKRYQWLSNDQPYRVQALHALTLTAGFSTVEWFKAKKFKVPLQANVGFSRPLAGRNVTKNDMLAGELVLFF